MAAARRTAAPAKAPARNARAASPVTAPPARTAAPTRSPASSRRGSADAEYIAAWEAAKPEGTVVQTDFQRGTTIPESEWGRSKKGVTFVGRMSVRVVDTDNGEKAVFSFLTDEFDEGENQAEKWHNMPGPGTTPKSLEYFQKDLTRLGVQDQALKTLADIRKALEELDAEGLDVRVNVCPQRDDPSYSNTWIRAVVGTGASADTTAAPATTEAEPEDTGDPEPEADAGPEPDASTNGEVQLDDEVYFMLKKVRHEGTVIDGPRDPDGKWKVSDKADDSKWWLKESEMEKILA